MSELAELYPGRLGALLIAVDGKAAVRAQWNTEALARYESGEDCTKILDQAGKRADRGLNIGLVIPPGCVALDADDSASAAYVARIAPDAPEQRTSKGAHYLFRLPDDRHLPQRVGVELDPGIKVDLRVGGRGYLVCEPSIHPDGTPYAWRTPLPASLEDIPELPSRWLAKLAPPAINGVSPGNARGVKITEGQRNHELFRIAAGMRGRGLSLPEIRAEVERENRDRCDPPLDEAEVEQIVASTVQYPAGGGEAPAARDRDNAPDVGKSMLICATDVETKPVKWVFKGRIPAGKVDLIVGDPGLGKTTAAVDLAARVTTGMRMPDGGPCEAGGVMMLSFEDGAADTLVPRFAAAGADLDRVHLLDVDRGWAPELPADADWLEGAIREHGIRMLIIDPLEAAQDSASDSHKSKDVRKLMAALAGVAERTGAAIVGIGHLNKNAKSTHAVYRVGGSLAYVAAARSVLLVATDPEDETRRVMTVAKNNLCEHPSALGFKVVSSGPLRTAAIDWLGTVDVRTEDLLVQESAGSSGWRRDEAREFLSDMLTDGPAPAGDVKKAATQAGLSWRTVERAKEQLGVLSVKTGLRGPWAWTLPEVRHAAPLLPPRCLDGVGGLGETDTPEDCQDRQGTGQIQGDDWRTSDGTGFDALEEEES